ncbi:MAG: NAD-dependent epimerase/dehydratase family protein [Deltaproteobacteria bacterium]
MDLLTGATGFLGRHLTRRLANEGQELRALVRVGTDLRRIPAEIKEIVWGSLDDAAAIARATHGIDTIYHLAARVSSGGSRDAFERDNVVATESLLEAAEAAGVRRLVHISSAGIYGSENAGAEITEETPLDPRIEERGAYAWSKAEADRKVRAFGENSRLETIVIRPGLLYGAETTPFVARLHFPVPKAAGRRVIVGRKNNLLPFTHVDNACDAIALASRTGKRGQAYNVVDGLVTQQEYLDALDSAGVRHIRPIYVSALLFAPVAAACDLASRLLGRSLPLSRYKLQRATESLRYDTKAAHEELGWRPSLDLKHGVASFEERAA